jgi:lipoprotein-releasing system permease protein
VDYRLKIAVSMLFKKKSSMLAAVIAVAIAVFVIVINYVTFDGVANAIIRDLIDYRFGHIVITDRDGNIEKPDRELIGFLENTGMIVEGATVRLSDVAAINNTRTPVPVKAYSVPIIGVLPQEEADATRLIDTVMEGTFLTSRDSIILGDSVAEDLDARIGDPMQVKVIDQSGNVQTKRFTVVGISKTAGGLGFDTSAIVHIETLRDMNGKDDSSELIVRLFDQRDSDRISQLFLTRYAGERFQIETIEESGESILQGIRSGIAFINLVGYFGMLSSAFGIITIMMMIVTSKIREIGVIRAIGSNKIDVMIIFLLQGSIIGAMGAALGFLPGSFYALYAQNSNLTFGESLSLAVRYDPVFVANTALTGLAMGVVASIYPAWRTTKLEPSEATRY